MPQQDSLYYFGLFGDDDSMRGRKLTPVVPGLQINTDIYSDNQTGTDIHLAQQTRAMAHGDGMDVKKNCGRPVPGEMQDTDSPFSAFSSPISASYMITPLVPSNAAAGALKGIAFAGPNAKSGSYFPQTEDYEMQQDESAKNHTDLVNMQMADQSEQVSNAAMSFLGNPVVGNSMGLPDLSNSTSNGEYENDAAREAKLAETTNLWRSNFRGAEFLVSPTTLNSAVENIQVRAPSSLSHEYEMITMRTFTPTLTLAETLFPESGMDMHVPR